MTPNRLQLLLVRLRLWQNGKSLVPPGVGGVIRSPSRPSRPESSGVVIVWVPVVRSQPESESLRDVQSRSKSTRIEVGRSQLEPSGAMCL